MEKKENSKYFRIHSLKSRIIYSIILPSRHKKGNKGRVKFILFFKIKDNMKNLKKTLKIVLIASLFLIAIILLKYKPVYKVTLGEQEVRIYTK